MKCEASLKHAQWLNLTSDNSSGSALIIIIIIIIIINEYYLGAVKSKNC